MEKVQFELMTERLVQKTLTSIKKKISPNKLDLVNRYDEELEESKQFQQVIPRLYQTGM